MQKPVYEEVDEDEYQKIIRERQENDFVVDDGWFAVFVASLIQCFKFLACLTTNLLIWDGSGYVDHGLDFFDDEELVEEYNEPRKKKAKGGELLKLIYDKCSV